MRALHVDFTDGTRSVLARAVAAEIRARMAAQRISGKALAEQIGVSQNYLATRLRDEKPFTIDDVEAIVQVLIGDIESHTFIAEAYDRQSEAIFTVSIDEYRARMHASNTPSAAAALSPGYSHDDETT